MSGGLGWPRLLLSSYCERQGDDTSATAYPASPACRSSQGFAPELLRSGCEPMSLSVRVAYSVAAKLLAQHRILCEQILGDALVVSPHPSGDGQEQEMQRQARHRPEPSAVSGGALASTALCSARSADGTLRGRYLQPPAVAPLSELESAWLAWIAEPSSPPPSTVLTPASSLFPKWLRAMVAPQRAAAAREDATFNRRYGRL